MITNEILTPNINDNIIFTNADSKCSCENLLLEANYNFIINN